MYRDGAYRRTPDARGELTWLRPAGSLNYVIMLVLTVANLCTMLFAPVRRLLAVTPTVSSNTSLIDLESRAVAPADVRPPPST